MPPDALDDSARWARVSDVFDVVADLPVDERPAALDRLCRDADGHPEAGLRAEVESLLAADADATLSTRSLRPVESVAAAALLTDGVVVGERIGPWRVLRELGRGGMGRVDLDSGAHIRCQSGSADILKGSATIVRLWLYHSSLP